MSPREEIVNIKARFVNGVMPLDELLLHWEPVLSDAISDDEKAANKLVNAIEDAMFALNEPQRTNTIVECLDLQSLYLHDIRRARGATAIAWVARWERAHGRASDMVVRAERPNASHVLVGAPHAQGERTFLRQVRRPPPM